MIPPIKKHSFRIWIIFLFLFSWTRFLYSQGTVQFENEFNYTAEGLSYSTPSGQTGTEFLGWLQNMSTLKFGNKHSINLSLMVTHDNMPSALRVGDLQTFSNLEAGNLYGFYEAYYQYETEKLAIKIGSQDINSDLFVTENGLLFTHSSMGIDPVATINMPAPTYPFTAFATTVNWQFNKNLRLRLGFFDGQFSNHRDRFLPISWSMHKNQGFIYILEPEFSFLKNRIKAKIGAYHHSGQFAKKDNSGLGKFWGFYNISDIVLSETGNKAVHLYYQIHATTKVLSDLKLYYGLGLRFLNAIPIQCENELGVGFANANVNTDFTSVRNEYDIHGETVLEVNWKVKVNDQISVQPYIQFINIREIDTNLKEPLVIALRGYLTL